MSFDNGDIMKKEDYSEALELMIRRKRLLKESKHLDRDHDEERFLEKRDEAHDLLEQVRELGGINQHEAYILAHVH